jgi:hypothetical protein
LLSEQKLNDYREQFGEQKWKTLNNN